MFGMKKCWIQWLMWAKCYKDSNNVSYGGDNKHLVIKVTNWKLCKYNMPVSHRGSEVSTSCEDNNQNVVEAVGQGKL